jgi:hypothetical protein
MSDEQLPAIGSVAVRHAQLVICGRRNPAPQPSIGSGQLKRIGRSANLVWQKLRLLARLHLTVRRMLFGILLPVEK